MGQKQISDEERDAPQSYNPMEMVSIPSMRRSYTYPGGGGKSYGPSEGPINVPRGLADMLGAEVSEAMDEKEVQERAAGNRVPPGWTPWQQGMPTTAGQAAGGSTGPQATEGKNAGEGQGKGASSDEASSRRSSGGRSGR